MTARENQPAPAPESTVIAANNQVAAQPPSAEPQPSTPAEQPKIAANEPKVVQERTAPEPSESVQPEVRKTRKTGNTDVAAAIPTARPVSPEVRRAEPLPPAEAPEDLAPTVTETKKTAPATKVKKDRAAKPKRVPEEEETTRVAEEPENAKESPAQLPRGRTRARFIGVTADGNWMFSLPSKKIVIVPPPPGG
ncbi:MAG TPA: hypothetical protein VF511_05445 [Chthoniobacterales bacterium]